jgi:GntR family transcriptional regulator of gluconate operon
MYTHREEATRPMKGGSVTLGDTSTGNPYRSILEGIGPRRTRTDEVAERVRELVLAGRLPAGTRLSDTRLSEEIGVGRSTVREAFKLLLAEGFLERAPQGMRIARLTPGDVNDIYDLRQAIECRAVEMLAERHSDAQIEELESVTASFEGAVRSDDVESAVLFDLRFHEAVCRLCGSGRIHQIFRREVEKMLALVRVDLDFYQPLSDWSGDLREILNALRRGDAAAATSALHDHIESSRSLVVDCARTT